MESYINLFRVGLSSSSSLNDPSDPRRETEGISFQRTIWLIAAMILGTFIGILLTYNVTIDCCCCVNLDGASIGCFVDLCRSILMIVGVLVWIWISPKFENRVLDPVTLPPTLPRLYKRRYKRRKIRHYLNDDSAGLE